MTSNTSILASLKTVLLGCIIILISNSCTKNEVAPTLVDKVLGTYNGKIFRLGGQDIPLPLASQNGDTFELRFEVTKGSNPESVNMVVIVNQKVKGVKSQDQDDYVDLLAERGLDEEILLTKDKKTQATVKGKLIEITFEVDGLPASFIGERP